MDSQAENRIRDLYICDNLPVLRGLETDSVDLIYLDPPFNSKKTYRAPIGSDAEGQMFDDTWRWDEVDTAWFGEIDRRCPPLARIIEAVRAARGDGDAAYVAMMGIRLIQLRRVLKPTGTIYLHCDDTATHLLRLSMDAVFKKSTFHNEIVWRRYGSHNDTRKFGRVCDRIHYYAGEGKTWNPELIPLSRDALDRDYRLRDEAGRYTTAPLHGRTLSGGGYDFTWRGIKDVWRFPSERLDELDANRMIYWPPKGNVPRRKVYYDPKKSGIPLPDLMDDIGPAAGREYTGWKTQKPVSLLQRLIRFSSNRDDLVLDPFCGCATACVAAEVEGRQWIGIDACDAAADITRVRLCETSVDFNESLVNVHFAPPSPVDVAAAPRSARRYRTSENIDQLYGLQHGECPGCGGHYRVKDFHIDHVVSVKEGGGDEIANLQLLCGHCNSTKSTGTMDDLWERLTSTDVIQKADASKLKGRWAKRHSAVGLDL